MQQHPIAALHQFRGLHPSGGLWCAEADIRNFYDTLDHAVAREAFVRHIDRIPPAFRDRAVMEVARRRESELFCRRYCDDMLLVSPDRGPCEAAFDAYRQTLHDLKIPEHLPIATNDFGREFAHLKSKVVYPWGDDPHRHAARVSCVGYQIRHVGQVRIRPTTVKKHMMKMQSELHDLHRLVKLGHVPRASKPRIFSS